MSFWVLGKVIYDCLKSVQKSGWILNSFSAWSWRLTWCHKCCLPHLATEHALLSWFDLWDTVRSKNYILPNYHVGLLFQNGSPKFTLVLYCWSRAKEHYCNKRTLHSLPMGTLSWLWRLNELAWWSLSLMTTSLM